MDPYHDRFSGIARLLSVQGLERLKASHVMVIGIGGVGSWVAESLARSGVGALTLVDMDDVCITNTNRQIHAIKEAVGTPKVSAMAKRIRSINPDCELREVVDFFTTKTAGEILDPPCDYVVDAIDGANQKAALIAACRERGRVILTVGGAGGRRDPTQIQVADLNRTLNDSLLKRVRKRLRQKHEFPRGRARWNIPSVWSAEAPVYPTEDGEVSDDPSRAGSLKLDCASGYGTASFVTGAFAFATTAVVVRHLIDDHSQR